MEKEKGIPSTTRLKSGVIDIAPKFIWVEKGKGYSLNHPIKIGCYKNSTWIYPGGVGEGAGADYSLNHPIKTGCYKNSTQIHLAGVGEGKGIPSTIRLKSGVIDIAPKFIWVEQEQGIPSTTRLKPGVIYSTRIYPGGVGAGAGYSLNHPIKIGCYRYNIQIHLGGM